MNIKIQDSEWIITSPNVGRVTDTPIIITVKIKISGMKSTGRPGIVVKMLKVSLDVCSIVIPNFANVIVPNKSLWTNEIQGKGVSFKINDEWC